MTESTALSLLRRLRETLTARSPYCSGTLELSPANFELYYGKEDASSNRFINLSQTANTEALGKLAQACDAAKFGRGTETVLDETYRKAGKMDAERFVTRLDVEDIGLLKAVNLGLLPRRDHKLNIRAELYKLNVYGEGAFFKPHRDTPRGKKMFGSLVVVFPTAHEGGALVLRHRGDEWTFDSAAMLAGRANSLAYVAFFSDVEHEVMPVVSGHRVTLTYNLYYGDRRKLAPTARLKVRTPINSNTYEVKDALGALLSDPTFMPEGGTLGFGLNHSYAFPATCGDADWNPFKGLSRWLKGSDAVLYKAWTAMGMEPKFRLVSEHDIVLDHMVNLADWGQVECVERALLKRHDGLVLKSKVFSGKDGALWREGDKYEDGDEYEGEIGGNSLTVYWVTNPSGGGPRSDYLHYGNEASLGYFWTRVCILVDVPGVDERCKTLGRESGKTAREEEDEDEDEEADEEEDEEQFKEQFEEEEDEDENEGEDEEDEAKNEKD
ncbi:hypothetical protein DICSQDRAFT_68006 [Dichomitus squalens LYAD-421 SS1]|uniref:Fe2OG dioxygenase domain-containing protein n=1 Tax=Dichomitus squalens (strain LYAD-421) TaxID=732165 RepID=R7SPV7_DICSQ|nr:uncharacterized protein DICSQDRAFT_68006 [Dichomitus squalens LYAD-421 SS1]EJF57978.1 hypothetical protein DICSQDRAFT_68006 [Dichomitus squalens LYAD-421 SS1]